MHVPCLIDEFQPGIVLFAVNVGEDFVQNFRGDSMRKFVWIPIVCQHYSFSRRSVACRLASTRCSRVTKLQPYEYNTKTQNDMLCYYRKM